MGEQIRKSEKACIGKAKYAAKGMAGAGAILLTAFFIPVPFGWATALLNVAGVVAFIALIVTGCQCLFHGSKAISISLRGTARRRFQFALALLLPGLLSLYFLNGASSITPYGVMGHMLRPWPLVMLGLVGFLSWALADQLEGRDPTPGFVSATLALFALCFLGHHGVFVGDSAGDPYLAVQSTVADQVAETGRYAGLFLTYVAAAYAGMLAKLRMSAARHPNEERSD
ncbi:MAG: hypothetical protein ACX94A_03835 [Algiphilus sp.]